MVDNGSTDGSAQFILENHPQVRLIALEENLGFGGGSNEGFRHARHDIVVLLNSDMRVERDFLRPLLDAFRDDNTFAVSCQIFFTDPDKLREETGLTEGWWQQGALRVRHRTERVDPRSISVLLRRRRLLRLRPPEVSGARRIRPNPRAVLHGRYRHRISGLETRMEGDVPACQRVYHEHRGTIGRRFAKPIFNRC